MVEEKDPYYFRGNLSKTIEYWHSIPGYEGLYEIGSFGNVKSLLTGKLFLLTPHQNGYVYVGLTKNKITTSYRVHRLVAIVYIANPEHKPCVNHKKGNKADNRWFMIEWATNSENDLHAYKIGLRVSPKVWAGKFGKDHNRSVGVKQILARETVSIFGSINEAERETGIAHQNIIKCCKNKRPYAGGYEWEYA